MKSTYDSHFVDSFFNIIDYIDTWPNNLQKEDISKFVNFVDANMLFIPVFKKEGKEKISRKIYYCSICKKWLKISDSIKHIKQHAAIHVPNIFTKETQNLSFSQEQKKIFLKNITAFILFENNSFKSIESKFLKNITNELPSREKITIALSNIAKFTRNEIKSQLAISSANYLTFDQWSDPKNREYLGITIRSYIHGKYYDFFLDLIYLYSEVNSADILSNSITASLKNYGLYMFDIISCTTDNCPLMIQTAEKLLSWRIPCVLHIFNKIFQTFIEGIKEKIKPIFELLTFLNKSSKYQNYIDRQAENHIQIKKVPSYTEVRWTSFCDCMITLYETKDEILDFLELNRYLDNKQNSYLLLLQKICKKFKKAVLTYENDSFGAISYFLADIQNLNSLFTELETSEFGEAATKAKDKISIYKKTYQYFWNVIAPIAVILNPKIEEYKLLLTQEQIKSSKKEIERRMKNYPEIEEKEEESDNEDSDDRLEMFRSLEGKNKNEVPKSPLIKLLENRNRHIKDLQVYWEKKIGTCDNQIAMVALEVLGVLVTSAMSERSFSKGRYVINEHRTNLLPEHARDHLFIKCNREIAEKSLDIIDIFKNE